MPRCTLLAALLALLALLACSRSLPLRPGVPVPPGVEPVPNLVALPLAWDDLAAETARLAPLLARWPEGFEERSGLPAPSRRP